MQIGRIALPSWYCREFIGSSLFILLFAAKALLRLFVSKTNGQVLGTMLHGKPSIRVYRFVQAVLMRFSVGLGLSIASGAIEGIRPWLIGCYRERLSRTFQRRFYEKLVYYQASVLDNRLEAADTVIATYCGEFAEHFAELPYYFILPGMECITSTMALVKQSGLRAAMVMGSVVTTSVLLLRALSPSFGHIHALLLSKEDDYRRMLGANLANVENIAMHGGGQFTRHRLDASLRRLKYTLDHMALAKGNFQTLEVAFTTFLSVFANMVTFWTSKRSYFHRSVNDIYLEVQLIEDLNVSVKDFVVNFRELSHLTEFSEKMAQFDTTLDSIARGTFVHGVEGAYSVNTPRLLEYTDIRYVSNPLGQHAVFNMVQMDRVTLKSPAGQVLFQDVSLCFRSDEDWVIIGENGCGKTSLVRMITGLWLPYSGQLTIDGSIRYLMAPQHSYMVPECTLYEQICFPERRPAVTQAIRDKVMKAIELAGAGTVVTVIGGAESRIMGFDLTCTDDSYDWNSLSGGQKQRISMARVFFHVLTMDRTTMTPVAILDEATSMMDDTEQDVLNHLRQLHVRMISVTHREVVIRHHTNVLKIKKGGLWTCEKVKNPVKVGERVETLDETV
ncbi:ATP-binding protein cassette, subfamily D (ALD), member 3 [Strigomonas culicis]|nr:ATP-binding protein cassette, subfamily D (ALD), member 3 [Strigomonas culicis]|eukprot:EPY18588.1 ATP-binding protein cassette, subfamily D (ALD), member 3 [Strigomonas culicis]